MTNSKTSANNCLNEWLKNTEEYKAGKTFEYVMEKYGFERHEILRLAGNESTIGTSPKAIKAAQIACLDSNFYDEPKAESLIEAITNYYQLDSKKIGVVVANGMDSIIDHLFMIFCSEDSSVVNLPPSFIYYEFAAKRRGIEIIEVARVLDDGSLNIDVDLVINNIKNNTKIIFLCSPNNPDGNIVDFEDIEKISKVALEKNIIVFLDHAYIDFTDKQGDTKKLINKYPNLILGYTFSKAFGMAGYRVGYALMDKDLQKKFLTLSTPFLNTKASIAAAKEALLDTEHYKKIIQNNSEQKPKLKGELEKLGFTCLKSEANFLLFYPGIELENKLKKNLPENSTVQEYLLESLMSRAIIIRGINKLKKGSNELNSLRVTIGKAEENKRFIEALSELVQ